MSDELTEQIIGAAIEVHRVLGPGLLKSIYEESLCLEMELRGIPYQRQTEVEENYKGHAIKGQKIDILVAAPILSDQKVSFHSHRADSATHRSTERRPIIR